MGYGAVEAVKNLLIYALTCQNRAHRHVATRQCFGEQYHVRFDAPVLDREEPPGAAEPGLNLVGNKQSAMTAAQRSRLAQIIVGGYVDAFALDRLDDERPDVARRDRPLPRGHTPVPPQAPPPPPRAP